MHKHGLVKSFFPAFALVFGLTAGALASAQMSTPGQFGVSPSGAATYSIPIQVPPGVAGMQPKLSLEYNSQGGNGILGMGWNLSGLSAITRCPKAFATDGVRGNVNYTTDDRFCLDGQRLLVTLGDYGGPLSRYRTEMESFSKITAIGGAAGSSVNGPEWFEVRTKAGVVMHYGATVDSRIEAQGKAVVRVWALNKVIDAVANTMHMVYEKDSANGDFRIKRIDYGANAQPNTGAQYVSFDYETRSDTSTFYVSGSAIKSTQRLTKITAYTGGIVAKEYRAGYATQPTPPQRSELISLTECNGSAQCLPSTVFANQSPKTALSPPPQFSTTSSPGYHEGRAWVDVNGDGVPDYCRVEGNSNFVDSRVYCTLSRGDLSKSGVAITSINSDVIDWGYTSGREWVDVNGDGLADFCRRVGNDRVACNLSTGSGFGPTIASGPIGWGEESGRTWVDINGDGRADFCRVDQGRLLCTLFAGDSFGQTIYSDVIDAGHITTRQWVDFNGDGLPDFCRVVTDGRLACTLSTGLGFGATIYSASSVDRGYNNGGQQWVDVNGDGLADYCRVVGNTNLVSSSVSCTLSTGAGFGETINSGVVDWGYAIGRQWLDINGDGMADFCRKVGNSPNFQIACTLSTGVGFSPDTIFSGALDMGYDTGRSWVDINGDGLPDYCRVVGGSGNLGSGGYSVVCSAMPVDHRLQLASVRAGVQPPTQINYSSLTIVDASGKSIYSKESGAVYPLTNLIFPLLVVSEINSSNMAGGTNTVAYQYAGLNAQAASITVPGSGRGMFGFRSMTTTEKSTGIQSYTEYSQSWPFIGAPIASETTWVQNPTTSCLPGRLCKNTGPLQMLKRSATTYLATTGSAANVTFVYLGSTVEESWDLNGGLQLPKISTYYEYNPNAYGAGNVTQYGDPSRINVTTHSGEQEVGNKVTINTYKPADESKWELGRLLRAQVTSSQQASSLPWPVGGVASTAQVSAANNPASTPAPLSTNQATGVLMNIINFLLSD